MEHRKKLKKTIHRLQAQLYKPQILILVVIIIVGFLFRFSNIPDRYGFDPDPTRDALVSLHGAQTLQLPLIGPHSGIGDFTFGPWYYYQLILFSILLPVPYAPWIYMGIASLAFIVFMYLIGAVLENKTLGLILAFIAAISPAQIGPTAGLSNPNLIPLYAALTVYLFIISLRKERSAWFYFLWGVGFGIGVNSHYQMLGLSFLPLFAFFYRKITGIRHACFFLLGIVTAFLPLIFFNLLNHWHTVHGFIQFLSSERNYVPNSWTIYLRDFWPSFWAYLFGVPEILGIALGIVIGTIFVILLTKRKVSQITIMFLITFVINFLYLRYYSGEREYYYLLYLHPLLFLFFGYGIFQLSRFRYGTIGIIMVLLVLGFMTFPHNRERLQSREDFTNAEGEVSKLLATYKNTTVTIYNCKNNHRNITQGIVYLLAFNKKISDDGVQIAKKDDECHIPPGAHESQELRGYITFPRASESTIAEYGWEKITPETVYADTVLWWKKEN